jgi:hypothetical protein
MQLVFGAGNMYGVPLFDASGNAITNPTPIKIGAMQEMSVDFSGDLKELYGQNQFALASARGKVKISGKIKGAQIHGAMLNNLFFGQTLATGTLSVANTDVAGAPIPATPYQITVVPPGSGTYVSDLGVLDANQVPMTAVASAPATGQYSVSGAGVYTFAAADTGLKVFINYNYTQASAKAKHLSIANMAMGAAPSFKAYMQTQYQGKAALVVLYSAIASKLNMFQTKLDDFSVPELDFTATADAANNVADIYLSE